MAKREVNSEASKRIVDFDDKKVLLGLAFVFVIGTLFSGSITGNVQRTTTTHQLDDNELTVVEGNTYTVKEGSMIKIVKIIDNGEIIVQIRSGRNLETKSIQPGHTIYINGFDITNLGANSNTKLATIRFE
jgi:hypothetical protein